jgi:hypothetical protein
MTVREIGGRFGAWALGRGGGHADGLGAGVHGARSGVARLRPRQRRHQAAGGFCALVVADNLGAARTWRWPPMAILYVALMTSGGRGQPQTGGGAVALRDANKRRQVRGRRALRLRQHDGIALRNGYSTWRTRSRSSASR